MPYPEGIAHNFEGQLPLPLEHGDTSGRVTMLPLSENTHSYAARAFSQQTNVSSSIIRLPVAGRSPNPNGVRSNTGASQLTARERQVLDLLVRGLSSKCIAHELVISPRTVEVHRANLMRKMGVRNIATLVRTVFEAA